LSTSVKVQFFKTFILPYFDYSSTLLCYFSKEAIIKLAKSYYFSIFKLFKFKFESKNFNDVNNFLEKYGLYAFQHRFLERMLSFSFKSLFFHNSPENLKNIFLKNDSRNFSYNLRNSANLIEPMAKTNSGEKTFGYFYSRLINSFVIKRSMLKFATFKLSIYNNINLIFIDFVKKFKKFDINLSMFFCFQNKR